MIIDINKVPIPTWTEPAVMEFLAAKAVQSNYAVEIGTYFGASARVMLQANPCLHLWCVDKFDVFGSRQITQLFLAEWLANGHCELITGDSGVAHKMLMHMTGHIDLCFVDDGHQDWQVRQDIEHFKGMISANGTMVGHDYDGDNDVARGVHQSGIKFDVPVPRLWRMIR